MTDTDVALATLDKKADRLISELGLDPDGPPDQFTYEAGFQLGHRFAGLLPTKQQTFDAVAFEVLDLLSSIFPKNVDPETEEFQAYFVAPYVSKMLLGRGLTAPQIASIASVSPEHFYRLQRNGLSIAYERQSTRPRPGVNRRYSGLDGRQVHLMVDHRGVVSRPWPGPAAAIQPFVVGLMAGLQSWLDDPKIRAQIEPRVKLALAAVFRDPALGDLFDGFVGALERIAMRLRDSVPMTDKEREEVASFVVAASDLKKHKPEFLAAFADAARRIRGGSARGGS
jgi:hypothetical protein